MDFGICSYSFHRLLAAGKHDIFEYIFDCRELGATQLDPWNGHLAPLRDPAWAWEAGSDPAHSQLTSKAQAYLQRIRQAAQVAGLPFGCLAVDGAHIYKSAPDARRVNRAVAYGWLEVAHILGARQVRIDAGGPEELPDDVFRIIVEGYQDLVARGQQQGVEILMENHWGSSKIPENVVRIMDAVEGLGLLFDTGNWAPGRHEEGWRTCARYARAAHVKTHSFDDQGYEPTVDIPKAMHILLNAGYEEPWGIESCPQEEDEYTGVRKTIALMKRVLGE